MSGSNRRFRPTCAGAVSRGLPLWWHSFRAFGEQQDALAAEMLLRLAGTVEGRLADANPSGAATNIAQERD
jgi:hypothetical protein